VRSPAGRVGGPCVCCRTINAAASGKEDSSGDGSSGPATGGDDPSGLPNLPNLYNPKKVASPADAFEAPEITVNKHGQLTNGTYTLDSAGMDPHVNGTPGKSQFSFYVNSGQATLDAAAYADEYGLWVGKSQGSGI
jgi:hypothetical protein